MIIFERHDNILDSQLQTLVCPVNTVYTMGKGLALQFKERWPQLDQAHKKACREDAFFKPGFVVVDIDSTRKVAFIATKRHWRNPSQLQWVDHGLMNLAERYLDYGIQELAIPALGCGEGRLRWSEVRPLIVEHFGPLNALPVGIYCPQDAQHP